MPSFYDDNDDLRFHVGRGLDWDPLVRLTEYGYRAEGGFTGADEALGRCEAAVRLARAYAAERESMGKTIDRHEMIADYLDEAQTDIQGLRALAVHATFHEEMAQKLELTLRFLPPDDDDERAAMEADRRRHRAIARRFTPLLKYLGAEKAVEIARRGLQIHGGHGYSTEYGAEKLLRDALVLPIYEGTSQIQALMAMKDTLRAAEGDAEQASQVG